MKIRFFLILSTIMLLGILAGCGNGNNVPPSNNVYVQDSSANTGQLTVRVFRNSSQQTVTGARVAIYATFQDLQNNVFLSEFFTNNSGYVYFGYLNFGNYYVKATDPGSSNPPIERFEIAQIQAGKSLTRNIYLPN